MDISTEGHALGSLLSGDVQIDIGGPVTPEPPDPSVSRNVLILYGGVISYTGAPSTGAPST